jgi:hypothetical protein
MKPCKCCNHYLQLVTSYDPLCPCWDDKCLRNAIHHADPIDGSETFRNMLDCESERCIRKTLKEWMFGENKDKCGAEGRYFDPK